MQCIHHVTQSVFSIIKTCAALFLVCAVAVPPCLASVQIQEGIPGSIDIDLSTFHELRGEYKGEESQVQLRSKMSGAYNAVSYTHLTLPTIYSV